MPIFLSALFLYPKVGDRVPADARLLSLSTTTLSADEGSLTGESVTVGKTLEAVDLDARIQQKFNMLFSGTVRARPKTYPEPSSKPNAYPSQSPDELPRNLPARR